MNLQDSAEANETMSQPRGRGLQRKNPWRKHNQGSSQEEESAYATGGTVTKAEDLSCKGDSEEVL